MPVAHTTEITASSNVSFEDAIRRGLSQAQQTLENISDASVADQKVVMQDGRIDAYQVNLKVTCHAPAKAEPATAAE